MRKSNLMMGVALAASMALAGAGAVLAGSHGGGKPADAATQMMEKGMQQGMQMMKEMAGGDAGKMAAEMMKKAGMGQMAKGPADTAGKAATGTVEDGRVFVEMPEPQRSNFLAIMRGFMEQLDDIINAAAEGNFKEVARIAGQDMGPAHELIGVLREAKVPEEKIAEVVQRIRQRMEEVVQAGGGKMMMGRIVQEVLGEVPPAFRKWKQEHMKTGGFGRFMPPEMHVMGLQMHLNAAKLADVATAIGEKPTAEDYGKVLSAIGEITTQCRGCHASWKVMR